VSVDAATAEVDVDVEPNAVAGVVELLAVELVPEQPTKLSAAVSRATGKTEWRYVTGLS
jgi:hypothetical protein